MNKILLTLVLLVSALLWSCGDSYLAKEATPYRPFVVIVPERYSGDLSSIPVMSAIYAEKNQTVRMYLGVTHEDKEYFGEDALAYFKNVLWEIGEKKVNLPNFRYTFEQSGHIHGFLKIVDMLDDTVQQQFDIFVNEPNAIAIDFPYDGYNQIDPLNKQSLPLRWKMSGIDEWESATCSIYIHTDKDSLWEHPLANLDCNDEVSISRSFITSNLVLMKDSSFTFYWAVRATIHSEYTLDTYDSTEIARFSTKILNTQSTIKIPYIYNNYRNNEIPLTEVSIIAANGDTLSKINHNFSHQMVAEKIAPQSDVKVFIRSLNRSEYTPESLVVDIPEGTVLEVDTLRLKDATKPQAAFYKVINNQAKTIQFYLYDDGSGINEEKIHVVINKDTVSHAYNSPALQFTLPDCSKECKVRIYAEDHAKNILPKTYWTIRNVSTVYDVNGPFIGEGN